MLKLWLGFTLYVKVNVKLMFKVEVKLIDTIVILIVNAKIVIWGNVTTNNKVNKN